MSQEIPFSYTVQKEQGTKISTKKKSDARPSVWLSIFKWLFAGFLLPLFLACLVTSKISLLAIGIYYNETRIPYKTNLERNPAAKETTFIMMVLILMIPQFVSLVKAFWISLFRDSHPWPTNSAILLGFIAGLMEVVGLSFFIIVIVLKSTLTAPHCILIMNALFLVPIIWQMFKIWKNKDTRPEKWKAFLTALLIAFIFEITGIVILTYHVIEKEGYTIFAGIPLFLIFLSISWCPEIQKRQRKSREKTNNKKRDKPSEGMTPNRENVESGSSSTANSKPKPNKGTDGHKKTARGKATFISSLCKLILTPLVCAMFGYIFDVASLQLSSLKAGFENFGSGHAIYHFVAQVFTSLIGYILGGLACSMRMHRTAFALPLALATLISMALIYIPGICGTMSVPFKCYDPADKFVIPLAVILWVAQLLLMLIGCYVWEGQPSIMAKESSLFWLPSYNGAFLEQNIFLNRKLDEFHNSEEGVTKNASTSRVYICTTMYHETGNEMEQLLHSLYDIAMAEKNKNQFNSPFEAHIFFDGAVKGEVLNDFVLQLIALLPKTLKVYIDSCIKLTTPYGMQLRWKLEGDMPFLIHLKDNLKVKSKKRWSQAMYMSYVLDYKKKTFEFNDDDTFILATDADVRFTHESVQALLDLMTRDLRVGAVCGRTHPLGSGPIVWYQVFDYAIGHWFQKVANHVLGSVLCAPGCFSVYRACAIREVLPIYVSGVSTSVDFLTKDMGEDRWLCTLMVQSGWRLEYCAAAEDSTYCPETFDEFFKQRRRWIPSTLANLIQLIGEWKVTTENNDKISVLFLFYQALMVFSTLISPATVILIITGALHYAKIGVDNEVVTLVLLVLVTVGFTFICLYTKQDFQLKVAKLLTIVFALIMAFATVGMAAQIAADIVLRTKCSAAPSILNNYSPASPSSGPLPCPTDNLPADVSSLYLAGLVGIFLLAALMHPFEAFCLVHGVWYLFCLPSGYLLLIIYSICNMTDRSWGTRETKEVQTSEDDVPWYNEVWNKLKYLCTSCRPQRRPEPHAQPLEEVPSDSVVTVNNHPSEDNEPGTSSNNRADSPEPPSPHIYAPSTSNTMTSMESILLTSTSGETDVLPKPYAETPVENWLPHELKEYFQKFKDNGYDNTGFIVDMTDEDLEYIGISIVGHRIKLLHEIRKIPHVSLVQDVRKIKTLKSWLKNLGLEGYLTYFEANGYTEPRILEDWKAMDSETLKKTLKDELNITKLAHVGKLIKAIKNLQYLTPAQREIHDARDEIGKVPIKSLDDEEFKESKEYVFWEGLRETCLLPESAVFGAVTELKEKLEDLRDSALMVLAIANAIWIIIVVTLNKQADLKVLGTNAVGFAFLVIFGFIIVIQFLTLIWHRISTICHKLARAPWIRPNDHRPTTNTSDRQRRSSKADYDGIDNHGKDQDGINQEEIELQVITKVDVHTLRDDQEPLV